MQIRTDLAMESRESSGGIPGVSQRVYSHGLIEEIHVIIETDQAAKALDKAKGTYITLSHPSLYRAEAAERMTLARLLAKALRSLLPEKGDLMIVGLGNRRMTADALGSRVLDSLLITRHMKGVSPDGLIDRLRGVCAVAPGVLGVTGMETAEMVHGIAERVRPAAVIAIDALAAWECSRICNTIQVTDTGILPGSGVGNHRAGLTRETMGIHVIAIGVPMVVYAAVIARDALNMLILDSGISREKHEDAMNAMVDRAAQKGLGDLVVTPREVDDMVGRVARILADGLNIALQPGLSEEEIFALSHDSL